MTDNKHFYASSAFTWATTTAERNLQQLIKHMDKEGYTYNLFLVPLPPNTSYQIKHYQPQVEGTQWLGTFEKKGKRK